MKSHRIVLTIFIFCILSSCSDEIFKEDFESVELISSKGEKIYINSVNWGVTGDHQLSIISNQQDKGQSMDYNHLYTVSEMIHWSYFLTELRDISLSINSKQLH